MIRYLVILLSLLILSRHEHGSLSRPDNLGRPAGSQGVNAEPYKTKGLQHDLCETNSELARDRALIDDLVKPNYSNDMEKWLSPKDEGADVCTSQSPKEEDHQTCASSHKKCTYHPPIRRNQRKKKLPPLVHPRSPLFYKVLGPKPIQSKALVQQYGVSYVKFYSYCVNKSSKDSA